MVHVRESKGGESTDVMMKMVNGEPHGIFVLDAEPKELTIVLILGPIRMDQLSELKGLGGLGGVLGPAGPLGPTGPLGGLQHTPHGDGKDKGKPTKGDNQ
jgi:hypothetical protein